MDVLTSVTIPGTMLKRDGRMVPFDMAKIEKAAYKALEATGVAPEKAAPTAKTVAAIVAMTLSTNDGEPTVEQAQDLVEKTLVQCGFWEAARAYIIYREQHRQMREVKALVSTEMVDTYLNGADWRIKENANTDFSLQNMNNYVAGAVSAQYWLEKVYPPEIKNAHVLGDFHLHDLSNISNYCCGWDLRDLLETGFRGSPTHVESEPPKHFRSALGQLVNFLFTLQGESAGAQAVSSFDTLLAPYAAVDGLTYSQIRQAIQEFVFNMNIPTRAAGQVPFTNVTMDLTMPEFMRDEPATIGSRAYGELQEWADMINMAFAEVMTGGDAHGRGFGFPIPTYNVTPNWAGADTDVLDAVFRMTAKYGTPYFANFVNSEMKPEDVRSMCCRLRIDTSELKRRGGGLFGANPMTGSIGVVTLNLPRAAYLARGDEEKFYDRLAELTWLAVDSLEIKRKALERLTDTGLYPYTRFYLRSVKSRFGEYWANHFSTIGVVGGNEACLNLTGKDITTREGRELVLRTLKYLRALIGQAQERTGHIFNLEATPAEGTSYRLARLDKKEFPGIIVANEAFVRKEGAAPYYTNSTQLPVDATDDLFRALEHQDEPQCSYTGGTVFHVFTGEKSPDPAGSRLIVERTFQKFKLPYLSMTPTYSVCPEHGWMSGDHFNCPKCGRDCEVWSRVVGYYRPVQRWNDGKQAEFNDRRVFNF